jgi:hypothetical protein
VNAKQGDKAYPDQDLRIKNPIPGIPTATSLAGALYQRDHDDSSISLIHSVLNYYHAVFNN